MLLVIYIASASALLAGGTKAFDKAVEIVTLALKT